MRPRSIARLASVGTLSSLAEVPVFLAPAISRSPRPQTSSFSTTAPVLARDRSRLRGVSAIHRTGPRSPLEASHYPLPEPVPRSEQEGREINPNHGLWGFFREKEKPFPTPVADYEHGRAWSIAELRRKSWSDLHSLWWVCVRERNRIITARSERQRVAAGYGDFESKNREKTVRATQNAIKHVLRERWYAWQDARQLFTSGYRPEEYDNQQREEEERSRLEHEERRRRRKETNAEKNMENTAEPEHVAQVKQE